MERREGAVEVGHAAALGDWGYSGAVRGRNLGGAGLDMGWRVSDLDVVEGKGWLRGVRGLVVYSTGCVLAFIIEQVL